LATSTVFLAQTQTVVLKLRACSSANTGEQWEDRSPVMLMKDSVNVLNYVQPSLIHS